MKAILLGTALIFPLAAGAATLGVSVTGTPGTGVTAWTFGGEAVAMADGEIGAEGPPGFPLAFASQFANVLGFTGIEYAFFDRIAGAASVIVDPLGAGPVEIASISQVMIDDDAPSNGDDFGFVLSSGGSRTALAFSAGDTVRLLGSLTVGIDLNDLSAGGLPYASVPTAGLGGSLPLILSISADPVRPLPIPLPAGLPLMALGLGAVALLRRGRRG